MKYQDYVINGIAVSQDWIVAHREYLEDELRKDMRDHGFVPVLDVETNLRWEYVSKDKTFKFRLACKGLKMDPKEAQGYLGILSKEGVMVNSDATQAVVV